MSPHFYKWGDKEMSICERQGKALQAPVGNPLSVG